MPGPREIFATISESIGVLPPVEGDSKELTVSSYERKDVIPAAEFEGAGALEEQHVLDDYLFARKTLQEVVETGQEALQQALEAAAASGNAELYSSVSQLMKETSDTIDKLVELQHRVKKIKLTDLKIAAGAKPAETPGSVSNTNIFIGSTKDVMDLIKQAQTQRPAIEGDFQEVP